MHNRYFSLRVLIALVLLVTVVVSAVAAVPAQAQKANTITISFTQEPDSLNPMYTTQDYSGLARMLFLKSAWHYDDQLNLVPVLAKEIPSTQNGGISADGKTITIKLRPDAVWSDGTPVTSDDFVFTAEMYASPKNSPLGRSPYDIVKVTAPDKTTVVAAFKEPYAPWPADLFRGIIPAHILRPVFEKDGTLDKAAWNTNPTVGNGPFVLKEYKKGQFMLFTRNDKYVGGKAKLEQVLIKMVPDDAAQVAALKAADADLAYFVAPPDALDLKANFPIDIYTVNAGYNEGWFVNLNKAKGHPALQDVKVRQAITIAIDRGELVKGLLGDLVKASAGYWDPGPYQDPSLKIPTYDPDGAKKLLDEAGWKVGSDGIREKDGKKLKLRYSTNSKDLRKDAQRVVEAQLKKVGIAVELINHPNQLFLASYEKEGPIARGEFDVAQWSSNPRFPDPHTSRFMISEIGTEANKFVGSNWSHVEDKELDDLFQKEQITVDPVARTKLFNQISKIMADKAYWIPLWQDPDLWAVNKRVTGIKFSGGTAWWNVTEWGTK